VSGVIIKHRLDAKGLDLGHQGRGLRAYLAECSGTSAVKSALLRTRTRPDVPKETRSSVLTSEMVASQNDPAIQLGGGRSRFEITEEFAPWVG
jgi:hypothetical protein